MHFSMTLDFSVHPWVGMSGGCHLRWYPFFDGVKDDSLQTFPGLINKLMLLMEMLRSRRSSFMPCT